MERLDCFTEVIQRPEKDGQFSAHLQFRRKDRKGTGKAFFLLVRDDLLKRQRARADTTAAGSMPAADATSGQSEGYPLPAPWNTYSLRPSQFITDYVYQPTQSRRDPPRECITQIPSLVPATGHEDGSPPMYSGETESEDWESSGMGERISEGGILATTLFDECASNPQRLMRVAVHNALNYTGQVEAGFTSVVDGVGSYQLHSPIVLGVNYQLVIQVQYDDEELRDGGIGKKGVRGHLRLPCVDKVQMRLLVEPSRPVCPVTRLAGKFPWGYCFLTSFTAVQLAAFRYNRFVQDILGRTKGSAEVFPLDSRVTIRGVSDPLCGQFIGLVQSCSDIFEHERSAKGLPITPTVPPEVLLEGLSAMGSAPLASPTMKGPWTVDWFDFLMLTSCGDARVMLRLIQMITQFNAFELDDKHHVDRMRWMVAPEESHIPHTVATRDEIEQSLRTEASLSVGKRRVNQKIKSNNVSVHRQWMDRTIMTLFVRLSSACDLASDVDTRHIAEEDARDDEEAARQVTLWHQQQEKFNTSFFKNIRIEVQEMEVSTDKFRSPNKRQRRTFLMHPPSMTTLPITPPLVVGVLSSGAVVHSGKVVKHLFRRPALTSEDARHRAPVSAALLNKAHTSFTASRAVWCMLSLRQQVMAIFYSIRGSQRVPPLVSGSTQLKKFNAFMYSSKFKGSSNVLLRPPNDDLPIHAQMPACIPPPPTPSASDIIHYYYRAAKESGLLHVASIHIIPLQKASNVVHLALRWMCWIRYSAKQKRVREILAARRRRRRSGNYQLGHVSDILAVLQSNTSLITYERRFGDWLYYTRYRTTATPLLQRNTLHTIRRAYRLWQVFCVPQYRLVNASSLGSDDACRTRVASSHIGLRVVAVVDAKAASQIKLLDGSLKGGRHVPLPLTSSRPMKTTTIALVRVELKLPNRPSPVLMEVPLQCPVPKIVDAIREEWLSCETIRGRVDAVNGFVLRFGNYLTDTDVSTLKRHLVPKEERKYLPSPIFSKTPFKRPIQIAHGSTEKETTQNLDALVRLTQRKKAIPAASGVLYTTPIKEGQQGGLRYEKPQILTGYEPCIPGRRMLAVHLWKVNRTRLRCVFLRKWIAWAAVVARSRGQATMYRNSLEALLQTLAGATRRLWFSRWRQLIVERQRAASKTRALRASKLM